MASENREASPISSKLEVDRLSFAPCLQDDWEGYTLHYRHRETLYHITIQQLPTDTDEAGGVSVDGELQEDTCITLIDDRNEHWAEVRIVRAVEQVV